MYELKFDELAIVAGGLPDDPVYCDDSDHDHDNDENWHPPLELS